MIISPSASPPYQLAKPVAMGTPSRHANQAALISDPGSGPSSAAPMNRPIALLSRALSGPKLRAAMATTSAISRLLRSARTAAATIVSPLKRLAAILPANPAPASTTHSPRGRRNSSATASPVASHNAAIRPL